MKKKKRVSEFLEEEEIKALLRVPDKRSLQGKRDYALLLLMFSTGLRKAEVCSLKRGSIGTYRNQAVVDVIGKREKHRRVALNPDVVEALKEYRQALQGKSKQKAVGSRQGSEKEDHLFFTLGSRGNCRPEPITPKAIDCLMRRVKKKALINKRITPHTTRHTFATSLLDKGVDLKTLQELMGHSHIRTSEAYLHTSDNKKLEAVGRLDFT